MPHYAAYPILSLLYFDETVLATLLSNFPQAPFRPVTSSLTIFFDKNPFPSFAVFRQ